MSKIGEWIAGQINDQFPTLSFHQEQEAAMHDIPSSQKWAYDDAKRSVFAFEPYWDIKEKNILNIGTGVGGKLPFYMEYEPKSITGIEIDPSSIKIAKSYLDFLDSESNKISNVQLTQSDAALLPFPENYFDAIVSLTVFEHILFLESAINETFRVLQPGGLAFILLPPYYSPWGSHLQHWIRFPWPQLFFSEKTLLKVAAREDERSHLSTKFVDAARIDWDNPREDIPHLNKVTLRKFNKLLTQAGFLTLQLKCLPIGYERLKKHSSFIHRLAYQVSNIGAHIPYLQEIFITKMVFVLRKPIITDR